MFPTHPIRDDLEAAIRLAPDLASLKTAVIRSLESLVWDVREQAGRIDELQRQLGERR